MRLLIYGAALAVLLIGGWSGLGNEQNAPIYRTEAITRGSIAEVVTAIGTLNPIELVSVGTQVSGQVSHVYVKVNDQVKAGQLLAEIDPSLLEAQLKQSHSSLETARIACEQARRDLERARVLLAKDYIARIDVEHAQQAYISTKNAYDVAQTQVERDKVNLNYSKIFAPIDGLVISQDITLGQTVAASFQTPNMFKVAGDLTKMKIAVNLSEADISKVKTDMPVTFTVDTFPDRQFAGVVQTVNVNPNTQQTTGTVTYTIVVTVDNQDRLLLPGMTAYANITLSEKKDVLRIPATALRFLPPKKQKSGLQLLLNPDVQRQRSSASNEGDTDLRTIYLLRNNDIVPVEVKVGATDESYVEVSGKDISEGMQVITGIMLGRP
jgi:HlyD family secretion protein